MSHSDFITLALSTSILFHRIKTIIFLVRIFFYVITVVLSENCPKLNQEIIVFYRHLKRSMQNSNILIGIFKNEQIFLLKIFKFYNHYFYRMISLISDCTPIIIYSSFRKFSYFLIFIFSNFIISNVIRNIYIYFLKLVELKLWVIQEYELYYCIILIRALSWIH